MTNPDPFYTLFGRGERVEFFDERTDEKNIQESKKALVNQESKSELEDCVDKILEGLDCFLREMKNIPIEKTRDIISSFEQVTDKVDEILNILNRRLKMATSLSYSSTPTKKKTNTNKKKQPSTKKKKTQPKKKN